MDEILTTNAALEAELHALRLDNALQRTDALAARERALELAARCDALEAELDALRARPARPRGLWPFRRRGAA